MGLTSRAPKRPALGLVVRSHVPVREWAVDIASVSTLLAIAAAFAFRDGSPGFRHDWLWPADPHVFERWFVEFGISVWNPHGLGSGTQAASLDWTLAVLAVLAALGLSSAAVLFVALSSGLVAATYGFGYLVRDVLAVPIDRFVVRALGVCYALGPVCFQKAVAGHLLWLTAYAALPWFIAFVWLGCRRDTGARPFYAAAVVYAFSSAQIQFLAFDALAMFGIVAAHGLRRKAWLGALLVVAVGAVHNASALVAPFDAASGFALADAHATHAWEMDMSAPLSELALGGGYQRYERAALAPGYAWLPQAGVFVLAVLAAVGITRRFDRATALFAALGIGALVFASGWDGPLAPLFEAALDRTSYFTVFRELFHVMALYALALVVLAAYGCATLPKRAAQALATIALASVAPFLTGGLSRLVPSTVPVANERETGYGTQPMRFVLPFPEPLSATGLESGGTDPARMDDDAVDTMNAPPFVSWLGSPDIDPARQRILAADLGVGQIAERDDRFAYLAHGHEPNVGASFVEFDRRQRATRERFAVPVVLRDVRAAVRLETTPERDPLQYELADHDVPSGRDVLFGSSLRGNGIDRQWVSLRGWSWMFPQLANLNVSGVLTRSGTPLNVAVPTAGTLFVLAAGRSFAVDGTVGTVASEGAGAYRWWRWPFRTAGRASLRCVDLCAIARIRVSPQTRWAASSKPRPPVTSAVDVPARMVWPWLLRGIVPATGRRTLVFGRTYFVGWHLILAGKDLGPSRAVDAIFNGWTVDASPSPRSMRIEFEPQRRANALLALSACVETLLILACFVGGRRELPA